jgi:hypothetical protein
LLRGKDKKSPGFESSDASLEVGQTVRVYLGPAKTKPAGKDGGDPEKKMQASLIVILGDTAGNGKK